MGLSQSQREENNRRDLSRIDEYLKSGDLEMLGELYSEYMHLVYGVCLKYLKRREEAQDAVMAIFEKLLVEIEKHRVENFRSWLYVISKNYCLMLLRSEGGERLRYKRMLVENTLFMENSFDLHPIDRETEIDDKALEECIKKLKQEQMDCIRLFYYDNRCYREISEKLKMDEKKVKSHLQNAKRNLKICLESGYE